MSRHVRESRHVRAYVAADRPDRLVFRLEPGPHESWQTLFAEALKRATIRDAARVVFDQYVIEVEKDPRTDSSARAASDHIVRDVNELVRATSARYSALQDAAALPSR